ncbi:hypothetical protein [Streptomyces blastmyceticus]|uniref:Uncharacterized protein n=1 Tax=Streptomyces blastmyceticus TaxID=68180 RepID=A0ABN0Y1F1_9ACTN
MSDWQDLGLGHREHPLLGRLIVDTATGRTGILRAIAPEQVEGIRGSRMVTRAWCAPVGGGLEWTVSPDRIAEAKR